MLLSAMELAVRRRLRVFAWVTFLLAAPLLLAYARGYRVPLAPWSQWLTPQRPAVGAFVVRTVPRGATLLVDGKVVDKSTPTGLGSVPAGVHVIRIEKPGYRPWEKRIESLGGKVQYLLFTRLLPETPEEEVVRENVRDVSISPDERWLLVTDPQGLRQLPLRAGSSTAEVLHRLPKLAEKPLSFSWAPDGSSVALEVTNDSSTREFLGVLHLESGKLIAPPSSAQFVGWETRRRATVLFLDAAGRLWEQTAQGRPLQLADGVAAAASHPRGVLVSLARPDEDRQSPNDVLEPQRKADETPLFLFTEQNRPERLPIALPEAPRAFAVSPTGAIAALGGRTGTLFLLKPGDGQWRKISNSRLGFAWSPDGDKLLYQESPFDAWALNVSEERSVLSRESPELLIRLSTPLEGLHWFPDSQHVLFFDQDILKFAEIDPRDGHRIETLLSTNRGATRALVAERGDTLYVVARREERDVLVRLFLRTPDDR